MRFNQFNHVTVSGIGFTALALALFARTAVAQAQDATASQVFAIALDKPDAAIESSQANVNSPP